MGDATLLVDVTMAANGSVTALAPDAGNKGVGYQVGDTIGIAAAQLRDDGGTLDVVATILTVGPVNSTPGHFTKTEDSDQGLTTAPNLYMGSTTPLVLNSLTIKKGNDSLTRDALNEAAGTFKMI